MKEIAYDLRARVGLQYLLDAMSAYTPYGGELIRRPVLHVPGERAALEAQWHNVRAALNGLRDRAALYDRLAHLMGQVRDIRGTLRRCDGEVLTEVELFETKRFLLQLGLIAPLFAEEAGRYVGIALTEEAQALALLDPDGRRAAGFSIASGYAKPLAEAREEKRRLELRLRETPDGPAREALLSERRLAVAREERETLAVRARLTQALRHHSPALLRNTQMLGALDFAIQKARLALAYGMTRPEISEGGVSMTNMRDPAVADTLAEKGCPFTPVSIDAPEGATVITGANMGGKSVALRALALNVLLAQAGYFVCAERAVLPLFDAVHVSFDDPADASRGLSSFGAEIVRIEGILAAVRAGRFCLIALDEPARGTNPREGGALVASLAAWLADRRCVAVLATHYDGVARHARAHYQAAGLRGLPDVLPEDDRLAFLAAHMDYGLARVDADAAAPREALAVCRLLGLDDAVVEGMARALDPAE